MKVSGFEIAVLMEDSSGRIITAKRQGELLESSSTIKIPLLILVLSQMTYVKDSLDKTLARLPRHASQGAGILNWTDQTSFSLKQLIFTTLVYSDCLATNILIDYVGGAAKLSKWLGGQGLKTRLKMEYLDFSDSEIVLPNVGQTTCQEMVGFFKQLCSEQWNAEVRKLLVEATSNVYHSWFEECLRVRPYKFRHKTGSMIRSSSKNESIFNVVGSFEKQDRLYYFCLLSEGITADVKEVEAMKKKLAAAFTRCYQQI